jgi:hypothetical protein
MKRILNDAVEGILDLRRCLNDFSVAYKYTVSHHSMTANYESESMWKETDVICFMAGLGGNEKNLDTPH